MSTLKLRPTEESDLDYVLAAESGPDNRAFVGQWTRQQHLVALNQPDTAHLILEDQAGQPVGYVILADLDSPDDSVQFRRIVITAKGQGFGRQALKLIKSLAFGQYGAHRLWLDVKDHNERARHLYETEGFVVEGVLREALKTSDGYESLVLMSVLSHEYRAV